MRCIWKRSLQQHGDVIALQLQLFNSTGHRISGRLSFLHDLTDLGPVHLIGQSAAHHLKSSVHDVKVHLHQLSLQTVHFLQHETKPDLLEQGVKLG